MKTKYISIDEDFKKFVKVLSVINDLSKIIEELKIAKSNHHSYATKLLIRNNRHLVNCLRSCRKLSKSIMKKLPQAIGSKKPDSLIIFELSLYADLMFNYSEILNKHKV